MILDTHELGWTFIGDTPSDTGYPRIHNWKPPNAKACKKYPDFFLNETANALLLEKIRTLKIPIRFVEGEEPFYGTICLPVRSQTGDRKESICLSALALISKGPQ